MQVIFCELQMGDAQQPVFLVDNGAPTKMGEAPIDELPEFIAAIAKNNNVDKVILRGIKEYALKVTDYLMDKGLTVELR